MSIATITSYESKLTAPYQTAQMGKASVSVATDGGRLYTLWRAGGAPPEDGGAPTTSVALNASSPGAILDRLATGLVQRIARTTYRGAVTGTLWLADRLVHSGGLSATVTGAQTTNLPTAALTRYTSGDGVWIALHIFTNIGASATTITVSYTNQAGTAGRTSKAVVFGSAGFSQSSRFILIPLQSGDTGCRSVENVNLVATTGTAGNFGVVLFKPLMMVPVNGDNTEASTFDAIRQLSGIMPVVVEDACLFSLFETSGSTLGSQGGYIETITE